jgi:hypothetical protein
MGHSGNENEHRSDLAGERREVESSIHGGDSQRMTTDHLHKQLGYLRGLSLWIALWEKISLVSAWSTITGATHIF